MVKICALIPARYQSSRLPGKPLLPINGKTMIQRTLEQTQKSKLIDRVYVVSDDDRILNHISEIGGESIKVDKECLNGTERICYALQQIQEKYEIVVNVQGDEPFINPEDIDIAIQNFKNNIDNSKMVCSTLHYVIEDTQSLFNRNIGKLVLNNNNQIMYCSRAFIPHNKDGTLINDFKYYGHIGIFVFKASYLPEFLTKNTPCQLSEDIEWLKIIEQGYQIISSQVELGEISINTMEDYQYIINKYQSTLLMQNESSKVL
jgi:3-deoxy-manno-octulosonate cytidylyltransferase (CMP-KDO synthetase)